MKQPIAEILSQGDEVITGEIADTNAAWLASELSLMGFKVSRHTSVGDRLNDLVQLFQDVSQRADLCLSTGGLGPTSDDLTAEAISLAFDRPLTLDPIALEQIEDWYRRLDRPMPAVNQKQAYLPKDSKRLDNPWGTAPGFGIVENGCQMFFLPGVPREMKALFEERIEPKLKATMTLFPEHRVILHTIGIGESQLQELIAPIALPPEVILGFRAGGPENQVKLMFPHGFDVDQAEAIITSLCQVIGEGVTGIRRHRHQPKNLKERVLEALTKQGLHIFSVESRAAGRLAEALGEIPTYEGGMIFKDDVRWLARYGMTTDPLTEERVLELVERIKKAEAAATPLLLLEISEKPSTEEQTTLPCWLAVAGPKGVTIEKKALRGTPKRQSESATAFALDLLRRYLHLPLEISGD